MTDLNGGCSGHTEAGARRESRAVSAGSSRHPCGCNIGRPPVCHHYGTDSTDGPPVCSGSPPCSPQPAVPGSQQPGHTCGDQPSSQPSPPPPPGCRGSRCQAPCGGEPSQCGGTASHHAHQCGYSTVTHWTFMFNREPLGDPPTCPVVCSGSLSERHMLSADATTL